MMTKRKPRKARRRCGGGSKTDTERGTIRKYFPNICSSGMNVTTTSTKRMADEMMQLDGGGVGDDRGARMRDDDDGAEADGRRKKMKCLAVPDIDGQEPSRGSKSGSGKILLESDSVSSQGNGTLGSWKLGLEKKNLEILDKKSQGNSLEGGKMHK